MESHYETLEVSAHASFNVIKAAYRCLVQRHHPDKNPDDVDAGQRMTVINCAYSVLSDARKRQDYDLSQGIAQVFRERRGQGHLSHLHCADHPTSRPFIFRPLS
jgi:DnaJ-class molecular chaperone